MNKLKLPDQAPHFGSHETYFFGNGCLGAGGDIYGIWDYLVRPYSRMSLIDREEIRIVIDGTEHSFDAEMHRLCGTGMFLSAMDFLGLKITLLDFAVWDKKHIVRAVLLENNSNVLHHISVRGIITPASYSKRGWLENPGVEANIGECLSLDNVNLFFNTDEKEIVKQNDKYILESETIIIFPGGCFEIGLYHGDKSIERRNVSNDIESTVSNWKKWLERGHSLKSIPTQREKDIIEGALVLIKMQQGSDGGIMATPRTYAGSYVRDNHSALRGMMSAGHTEEAKKYLYFMKNNYEKLNKQGIFPIANSFSIGGDGYHTGFGSEEHHIAETPALLVLIAKMYFEKTKDIETINDMIEVIEFAVNVQVDYAEKNEYRLKFNGDETESGGCCIPLRDRPAPEHVGSDKWSMPSLVMCIKSVKFLNDIKNNGDYDYILEKLKDSLDKNFWRDDLQIYDWYRTPDGGWPELRLPAYHIMPLYFLGITEKTKKSALKMKQYFKNKIIPLQPEGICDDFCGHGLGYLLYALSEIDDEMKHDVYDALINGGTIGCWGTWSESYHADCTPYHEETWDERQHNMRPFETGVNIDAVMRYWKLNIW